MRDEHVKPALILGFPVGFVGAAESKAALACLSDDGHEPAGQSYPELANSTPFITLQGTFGGSAVAAAALNALAVIAGRPS
jgi:precorrin isomerase